MLAANTGQLSNLFPMLAANARRQLDAIQLDLVSLSGLRPTRPGASRTKAPHQSLIRAHAITVSFILTSSRLHMAPLNKPELKLLASAFSWSSVSVFVCMRASTRMYK